MENGLVLNNTTNSSYSQPHKVQPEPLSSDPSQPLTDCCSICCVNPTQAFPMIASFCKHHFCSECITFYIKEQINSNRVNIHIIIQ